MIGLGVLVKDLQQDTQQSQSPAAAQAEDADDDAADVIAPHYTGAGGIGWQL